MHVACISVALGLPPKLGTVPLNMEFRSVCIQYLTLCVVQICEQTAGKVVGLSKIHHAAVDIVGMCAKWTDPAELHAWGLQVLGVGKDTKRRYVEARQFVALEVARSSKRIQARQLLLAGAASMKSRSLSDVLGALFLLSSGCQAGIPMQRWAKY